MRFGCVTSLGVARKLRLKYPGAIDHVMNRGDRREPIFRDEEDRQRFLGEHHGGLERQETAVAERIVGEELQRVGWSEADLANRGKGDAGKAAIARRLRRENTTTLKWIAQRLRMGSASTVTRAPRQGKD
jgi:hypothetical protein